MMTRIAAASLGALMGVFVLTGCADGPPGEASAGADPRAEVDPRAARHLVQAEGAFREGAYNVALVLVDSARHYAPELADAYFLRGRILTELRRDDLARAAYERVLDLDPDYQGAWRNLGNAALRAGAWSDALALYRRELEDHPTADVWRSVGHVYEQRRMPDSARYAYEQAIAEDPADAAAHMRLGQLYKDRGEIEQAIAASREGLRLEPENLDYAYALGALLVLAGASEEAVGHLQRVVEARPWHYWAQQNLGRALVRLGRGEEAQRHFDEAERLKNHVSEVEYWQSLAENNPDQLMLWVKLAQALRAGGQAERAREADEVAVSVAPYFVLRDLRDERLSAENERAASELFEGNAEASTAHYEALVQAHPDAPDLWVNLGVLYAATGRTEEARRAWGQALRRDPNHAPARAFLFQLSQRFDPKR